ncbi:hypothetical protein HHI36_016313 [Cryptolaemus montrouzieri]|uniref:Uncharacterized protein n=1 Tax=Cryptolaemus montrouzieri TaxID=559131 RepID=A0ABD2NJU3_9CUCU
MKHLVVIIITTFFIISRLHLVQCELCEEIRSVTDKKTMKCCVITDNTSNIIPANKIKVTIKKVDLLCDKEIQDENERNKTEVRPKFGDRNFASTPDKKCEGHKVLDSNNDCVEEW